MTSTETTPDSVAATAARLQSELPLLEKHQKELEQELVSVTKRLESARAALDALLALSATYPESPTDVVIDEASKLVDHQGSSEVSAGREEAAPGVRADSTAPARDDEPATGTSSADHGAAALPHQATSAEINGGGLTAQVLQALSEAGNRPIRARDIAKVLGRDGSSGSINAVRSTLDRLVATSRADRAGRGLYQVRA
ncbi:hypothetical protein ACFZAV_40180 [Streptomyces sp. NPDC008343]|uniref:hypothetical protein n=1 Tax=Streptomyces sp. NPDC008343 TaxID=3364828 RepID=UPI0036E1A708